MIGKAELNPPSRQEKSPPFDRPTSVLESGPTSSGEWDADEEVLLALGYKQEFKREFSLWTTFCVSFAVLGLLPSFASTLYYVSFMARASPDKSDLKRKGVGVCRHAGHGLGLLDCNIFHSMRFSEHGGALFVDADERRSILRCSSKSLNPVDFYVFTSTGSRTSWIWASGQLAYGLV